jgi:hypothetical protein
MSKFKTGDRVEVIERSVGSFFQKGAGGTVVEEADDGTVKVNFTYGNFDTGVNTAAKGLWVMEYKLALIKPYSSSFTQQTSGVGFGDFLAIGHQDNGSGLQKHSVGDHYPWLVVGYGHGEHHVFCIQNLETGVTLGDHGWEAHTVRQWQRWPQAEAYLQHWLFLPKGTKAWLTAEVKGKPEFIDGVLQIKA